MRRFRRFRLPAIGWIRWPILLMAVGFLLLHLTELIILQPLVIVAEHEARLRAIDAVNRIVLNSLGQTVNHNDLVTYEKDSQGRIAAYHVNTQFVNQIAGEAATAVRNDFRVLSADDFGVPLGAITGSRILGTLGPRIPISLVPIGTVTIDLKQEFKAEGINQTRHRLWLHATARVRVILPMVSREVEVTSDLPITETVIVGPVPNNFYGGQLGGVTIPANP